MFAVYCGEEMAHRFPIIHIQPLAPVKPAYGAACNGCGVCCLAEPCPVGILLSRKRVGACDAVRWDGGQGLYRCGAVLAPTQVLQVSLPRGLRWSAALFAPIVRRLALRWIAVGIGCDSTLDVLPAISTTIPASICPTSGAPPRETHEP